MATDERKDLMATLFNVEEMGARDPDFMTNIHASTIYYKGYAYEISSDGQADKREMTQQEKELYDVSEEPVKVEEKKEEKEELLEQNEQSNENKEGINDKVDEQGE